MVEDTAPKKVGRPKGSTNKNRKYAGKLTSAALKTQLEEVFTVIGTVVVTRNQFDGMTIIKGSGNLADALVELSKGNDRVRKALEAMVTTSGYASVAAALGGILVPILINHGVIPDVLGIGVEGTADADTTLG